MCTSADVDRLRIIIPHFDSFSACIYLLRLTNDGIGQGLEGMNASLSQMETLQTDMNALQSAIPTAFAQAAENDLAAIDRKAPELESAFQRTLNGGLATCT